MMYDLTPWTLLSCLVISSRWYFFCNGTTCVLSDIKSLLGILLYVKGALLSVFIHV